MNCHFHQNPFTQQEICSAEESKQNYLSGFKTSKVIWDSEDFTEHGHSNIYHFGCINYWINCSKMGL